RNRTRLVRLTCRTSTGKLKSVVATHIQLAAPVYTHKYTHHFAASTGSFSALGFSHFAPSRRGTRPLRSQHTPFSRPNEPLAPRALCERCRYLCRSSLPICTQPPLPL